MGIEVKLINSQSDIETAFSIRRKVFVEEQKVPEWIEIDQYEDESTHILVTIDGHPAGTARWRQVDEGHKLERFAVLPEYRGRGAGREMADFMITRIGEDRNIFLYSQTGAEEFYRRLGFKSQGNIFYEAHIPHRKMVFPPSE